MKLAASAIIAAHVAALPTLDAWSGVPVYEGAALRRDDVREWCTVGYVAAADAPTVMLEPVPQSQGQQVREVGTILSQVFTAQGDAATARGRVFDLLADWVAWLGADRTIGGAVLPGSDAHLSVDVTLATTRAGGTANAVVTLTYSATTYG